MRIRTLFPVLAFFFTAFSHGQVIKCIKPDGSIELSDRPCASGRNALVNVSPTNVVDGTYHRQLAAQHREQERIEAIRAHQEATARAAFAGSSNRHVPSERDIKNMETSAGSITLSEREKLVRQAEINAAKQMRAGGEGVPDYSAVEAYDQRGAARRQAAAAETARQQAQTPMPQYIKKCDNGGCTGSGGERYTGGNGNHYWNGSKSCYARNGRMICN